MEKERKNEEKAKESKETICLMISFSFNCLFAPQCKLTIYCFSQGGHWPA